MAPSVRLGPGSISAEERASMHSRDLLMHQIAELDLHLSKGGTKSSWQQRGLLIRFEEILAGDCKEDKYVICQAIHYLMRKHDMKPTAWQARIDEWPLQ